MSETPLSRAAIVDAAIAVLNDVGLEQVSLRKVAERLGVKAPSLYWYVEDKAALHALMSETVFRSCLDAMPECSDWREWLCAYGRALWEAQLSLRDAAKLIIIGGVHEERLRSLANEIADKLAQFGIEKQTATVMQSSVQALVTGWAAFQQSSNAPFLNSIMSVEDEAMRSIEALVDGWSTRVKSSSGRLKASPAQAKNAK